MISRNLEDVSHMFPILPPQLKKEVKAGDIILKVKLQVLTLRQISYSHFRKRRSGKESMI